MQTSQPPSLSASGRIVIEGELPTASAASPENTPAQPLPPWWKFWKFPPETVLARATVLLAVATLMLFVIAVIQAVILSTTDVSTRKAADAAAKSASTAEEAVNQMDIAQRPWVRLSKAAPFSLSVMDPGVIVDLLLQAKNIGHSPAQGVYASGRAIPDMSSNEEAPAARAVCENAAAEDLEFHHSVLFPDEERQIEVAGLFSASMEEITKRRNDRIANQWSEEILGKEGAEAKIKEDLAQPIRTAFTVIGCILYRYRDGSANGKTAFALDIYKTCPELPGVKCTFDVSHRTEYRADEMLVTEADRAILFAR